MSATPDDGGTVREAGQEDAPEIGRLLDAFNSEYGDPTPGAEWLAQRIATLLNSDTRVFVIGRPAVGLAVVRERLSLWADAPEWYLAELYVAPQERGRGLGRALLERVVRAARERGAASIDLGTTEDDVAARSLYESVGFTRFEGGDGGLAFFYELEL